MTEVEFGIWKNAWNNAGAFNGHREPSTFRKLIGNFKYLIRGDDSRVRPGGLARLKSPQFILPVITSLISHRGLIECKKSWMTNHTGSI